eukprot:Rmarinus@m.13153
MFYYLRWTLLLFILMHPGVPVYGNAIPLSTMSKGRLASVLRGYWFDYMKGGKLETDENDISEQRYALSTNLGNIVLDFMKVRYPKCDETGNLAVSPQAAIRSSYRAQAIHEFSTLQDATIRSASLILSDDLDVYWNPLQGLVESIEFSVQHDPSQPLDIFFTGEYGYELLFVIPFAYYHHVVHGTLRSTRGCGHMSPFYFFSPNHTDILDCQRSEWDDIQLHDFGVKFRMPNAYRPPDHWIMPPFQTHFGAARFSIDQIATKPLACVCNKNALDNQLNVTNTFSTKMLETIFDMLTPHFVVVYIRPRAEKDVVHDTMTVPFGSDDFAMIRRTYQDTNDPSALPQVILPQNFMVHQGMTYNEAQLLLLSRCRTFVTVKGGTSVTASLFGGRAVVYAPKYDGEYIFRAYSGLRRKLSGTDIVPTLTEEKLYEKIRSHLLDESYLQELQTPSEIHEEMVRAHEGVRVSRDYDEQMKCFRGFESAKHYEGNEYGSDGGWTVKPQYDLPAIPFESVFQLEPVRDENEPAF